MHIRSDVRNYLFFILFFQLLSAASVKNKSIETRANRLLFVTVSNLIF